MKNKKPNAEHIWKQFEDLLVPRLRLSVIDRAVYSHLLRHSRLEGRLRLRFSVAWLARGTRLSGTPARQAVRRLVAQGALRLVERSKAGHLVEVRLPEETAPGCPAPSTSRKPISCEPGRSARPSTPSNVASAFTVSAGSPPACSGNSQKGERPAGDFLRWLYRERRLTAAELTGRLRALDALASGKLPAPLHGEPVQGEPVACLPGRQPNPLPRKGRPPLHPANQ